VGSLTDGGDFVAELLEIGGPLFDVRARGGVIEHGAVAGAVEAREERGAAGGAGGRGDEGVVERHAVAGDSFHVGCLDVLTAVDGAIGPAQIVGEEEDDIGARFGAAQRGVGEEQAEEKEEEASHVGWGLEGIFDPEARSGRETWFVARRLKTRSRMTGKSRRLGSIADKIIIRARHALGMLPIGGTTSPDAC
jgi:hypothetical protein